MESIRIASTPLAILLLHPMAVGAASPGVIPLPKEIQMTGQPADQAVLTHIRYKKSKKLGDEAYELHIKKKGITILYKTEAGRFYAEKTLEQLERSGTLYQGIIRDEPKYAYRGYMLDEARHFLGKEKVKELLDVMAEFKLNRFHWHLTDHQGWRIEIKAFPELTDIGAVGNISDRNSPRAFYTPEDIREIVHYAAQRHIVVIPEIDMPGHAGALVRSIPGLDGKHGTLNPGSERTYEVLKAILEEVAQLFPGPYIHLGGDEVLPKDWPALPEVASLMASEGFSSTQEIYNYFGNKVVQIVHSLGKVAMGWGDMRMSGASPDQLVLYWWQTRFYEKKFKKDLENGYRVIACPNIPMYFDYCQESFHQYGFLRDKEWFSKLEDIYEFTVDDNPLVIGVQANLWTELVSSGKRMDFMTYPRIIALAEVAWSSSGRNYEDFVARLQNTYSWMDAKGLYYYDARNPEHHPEPAK